MPFITKEEIIKLSKNSQIEVYDHEIDELVKQLEAVLSYAARLEELAGKHDGHMIPKNRNIVREDTICPFSADILLAQAPLVEEHYFVVPAIIKQQD